MSCGIDFESALAAISHQWLQKRSCWLTSPSAYQDEGPLSFIQPFCRVSLSARLILNWRHSNARVRLGMLPSLKPYRGIFLGIRSLLHRLHCKCAVTHILLQGIIRSQDVLCDFCHTSDGIAHILLQCPAYLAGRTSFLAALQHAGCPRSQIKGY